MIAAHALAAKRATRRRSVADLAPRAKELLGKAADRMALSARGVLKVLAVAHTIAYLAQRDEVASCDVAEALQYRPTEEVGT